MHGPGERLVLIVDDSKTNLDVLSNALTGAGFEVAVATSGAAALEQAARQRPGLILLAATLPDLSGGEACGRLKAERDTAELPVLFMTTSSDAEGRRSALRAGAADTLCSPFLDDEVVARVSAQIELRRTTRKLGETSGRLREIERAKLALEIEADRREEELREARAQITRELAERALAEEQRTALTQEIIAVQRQSLSEMSTPLIPITDRIMVMPMIGTMTEERAEQLLDTALRGVQTHNADVVIIDVTGMKLLDSKIASTLLETASALRLLGAQTVITGIRPGLAQTFTTMGVDLGNIVTRGTLKSGIAYALRRSGAGARVFREQEPQR